VRDVADEVIDIRLFLFLLLVLLEDEGLGTTETVMQNSDCLGIAEGQTSVLAGQIPGKFVEVPQIALNVNGSVEQNSSGS
jgi:hypothetical protein